MSEILINGAWGPAQSRAEQAIHNPATLKPLGMAPFCDAQDIVAAMTAARCALGHWRTLPIEARSAHLAKVGHALSANARAVAELQAMETGQPYFECLDAVRAAAQCFTGLADPVPGVASSKPLRSGTQAPSARPLLLDQDYPLLHWACSAVPLLKQGSTLVCVAPRSAPLAFLLAARSAGGLPAGVLNVLVASSETVTAALGDSAVREDGRPTLAGPGHPGSDAVFVGDNAELPLTLKGSASLRLFHSGQRPGQNARIFVTHRTSHEFADRLHEYLAFLEGGDPRNPGTDLGPLRSLAALQRVEDQVARALKHGALLKLGGRRYQPWGLRGYFFQPTLMIEGRGEERAPDGEIQGPVVVISPVRGLAEVLTQHQADRVSCFGCDPTTERQALSGVGIDFELTSATTPLERIMQRFRGLSSGRVQLETMETGGRCWFPYRDRAAAG